MLALEFGVFKVLEQHPLFVPSLPLLILYHASIHLFFLTGPREAEKDRKSRTVHSETQFYLFHDAST
ncbi:mitochondrial nuclease [Moniliophthora roreri]|nr:mitochondrial nuclease [Moniliophthora roreri]